MRSTVGRPASRALFILLPVLLLTCVHEHSRAEPGPSSGAAGHRPYARPEKCGTPWAMAIHDALQHPEFLDATTRALYEQARTRPVLQSHIDTDHFRIHYDTSGGNAVLGWPDTSYLDAVADALERSWRVEIDTLGFRPPPSDIDDPGDIGGNGLYDCYLIDLGTSFYGITFIGYTTPGGPPDDVTTYIEIDNDYEGFGYADPTVPMRVTVAHEFNHACQLGHVLNADDVWYMECSAVWTEDQVYDALNDYYQFLPYYLGHPYRSLEYRGTAMYGAAVWNFFLAERLGRDIVSSVWSEMEEGGGAVAALQTELDALGTSLADEFAEFAVWNWYIGSRDDGAHYEEGAAWSDVSETWSTASYPVVDAELSLELRPDHLGANYLVFENPNDICESVEIGYDGPPPPVSPQAASVLALDASGAVAGETVLPLDAAGDATLTTAGWDTLSAVVLVVANTSPLEMDDAMPYAFSADQAAPYNGAFAATVVDPLAVSVEWSLDTVEDLVSMRVERATAEDAPYESVGDSLPPALAGSVLDEAVVPGDDLFYRLVLVRTGGAETTIPGGAARIAVPGELSLSISRAMPNPFTDSVAFELALSGASGDVTVRIYDVAGRLVRQLASEPLAYGRHRVTWDGDETTGEAASSGAYLCSFEYEGTRLTRKLILLR